MFNGALRVVLINSRMISPFSYTVKFHTTLQTGGKTWCQTRSQILRGQERLAAYDNERAVTGGLDQGCEARSEGSLKEK